MTLWTLTYKFLCGHLIFILFGIYLVEDFLVHRTTVFNYLRNFQIIFQSSYPIYIPTSRIGRFHFLHILDSTSLFYTFIFWTARTLRIFGFVCASLGFPIRVRVSRSGVLIYGVGVKWQVCVPTCAWSHVCMQKCNPLVGTSGSFLLPFRTQVKNHSWFGGRGTNKLHEHRDHTNFVVVVHLCEFVSHNWDY